MTEQFLKPTCEELKPCGDVHQKNENSDPIETTEQPTTTVPSSTHQKKSTGRKLSRVFAVIGKCVGVLIMVLVIGAAGLFGYLTITEYKPPYEEDAQKGSVNVDALYGGQDFRILTFNTGYAALDKQADFFLDGGVSVNPDSEERVRENMLGIGNIIKDCNADFCFLQEIDTEADRTFDINQWMQYENDLKTYESRFSLNYSCNYVPYPLKENMGKIHSGIATFSHYDISSATRYSLPCPFTWPSRVANIKRCMLATRIPIENSDNKELVLVNFHLEAYDNGAGKEAQTRQLMDFIQSEYDKGNYVVAGGDFNQIFPDTLDKYPFKDTSQWLPGKLDSPPDGWKYAYDSNVPTCRLLNQPFNPNSSLTQYYIIDGFIVSPNLTVNSVKTLDEGFVYTDHNPVVMEVSITAPIEE